MFFDMLIDMSGAWRNHVPIRQVMAYPSFVCHTHDWVMSHTWMSHVYHSYTSHQWMSHVQHSYVTHMNESCLTNDSRHTSHIWKGHVTYTHESCPTYMSHVPVKWVMSSIQTSHATPFAYESAVSTIPMSHVPFNWVMTRPSLRSCTWQPPWQVRRVTHVNASCQAYKYAMSHVWMSRVTRIDESSHVWMSNSTRVHLILFVFMWFMWMLHV